MDKKNKTKIVDESLLPIAFYPLHGLMPNVGVVYGGCDTTHRVRISNNHYFHIVMEWACSPAGVNNLLIVENISKSKYKVETFTMYVMYRYYNLPHISVSII